MTNGRDIYFLDAGQANKRSVAGFFSPEDLENLLYLRQNRKPLTSIPINTSITNRSYQIEAVRRVAEAFEQGKRRALLVMATGTGKTRTAMSLVEVLLRANFARRILFVADRDPLVEQALHDGFEKHLPQEPCARIYSHHISTTSRLYVVTLQTLNNCFEQFTPSFFDVIIFDEVHRSIFNKWNEVLLYFDGRMIGLTATPAEFLDRNTFREFQCDDNVPTFLYPYRQAVQEGYLVDYALYVAQTKFQRKGIRGVDLSEEDRNQLIEQGLDPDTIDYSGTELEKTVSNKDTLRQQWHEIMERCIHDEAGQLPGKTIVFAMTQAHALRLAEVFEEMYPQHPGLARVITYKSDYRSTLINNFKKEELPRIAITVDLLETGIDVPEVVNLVVMKPVQSRIKLEQMIGRGTRSHEACLFPDRLPGGHKDEFLIIDFWENDFDKSPEKELAQSLPVLVSLFNTRLRLLELFLTLPQSPEYQRTVADLRALIARIPVESFSIKRVYPDVAAAWSDEFWHYLTATKIEFLGLKVGPLLRYAAETDVAGATFTHKVERLKVQILTDKDPASVAQSIGEDASRLPAFVFEHHPERAAARDLCLSHRLPTATVAELTEVIDRLADQMKYKREIADTFIELDLKDVIALSGYILLKGGTERIYVKEYRERVERRVLELIDIDPVIAALGRGEAVSEAQLIELERTLRQTLGAGDLEITEGNIHKAFGFKVGSLIEFVRQLLDLDGVPDYADIVRHQFDGYVAEHPFSAEQTRFLRALQNVFVQKRRLQMADLYAPPLSAFGADAVEKYFTPEQVREVLAFTATLAVD